MAFYSDEDWAELEKAGELMQDEFLDDCLKQWHKAEAGTKVECEAAHDFLYGCNLLKRNPLDFLYVFEECENEPVTDEFFAYVTSQLIIIHRFCR